MYINSKVIKTQARFQGLHLDVTFISISSPTTYMDLIKGYQRILGMHPRISVTPQCLKVQRLESENHDSKRNLFRGFISDSMFHWVFRILGCTVDHWIMVSVKLNACVQNSVDQRSCQTFDQIDQPKLHANEKCITCSVSPSFLKFNGCTKRNLPI